MLRIFPSVLALVRQPSPTIQRTAGFGRNLADQLRRALTRVVLLQKLTGGP